MIDISVLCYILAKLFLSNVLDSNSLPQLQVNVLFYPVKLCMATGYLRCCFYLLSGYMEFVELTKLSRTIYELSTPNPLGEYSRELYDYYKKIFEEYITSKVSGISEIYKLHLVIIKISSYLDSLLLYWFQVLPALNGKRDQDLLQEIVRRWSILKTMTLWLFRFFNYLDRYFIARRKLPSLQQTSYNTFYNLVSNGNS